MNRILNSVFIVVLFVTCVDCSHAGFTAANTFGPESSYQDSGALVAGPSLGFTVSHAFSFAATASGPLSGVEVALEYAAMNPGPHRVHFSITEKAGNTFPNENLLLESWTIDDFQPIGTQSGPISLSSTARPFISAGNEYWLWADWGTDETILNWMFSPEMGFQSTRAIMDNGVGWHTPDSEYPAAFRVSVVPEPSWPVSTYFACTILAGLLQRNHRRRSNG